MINFNSGQLDRQITLQTRQVARDPDYGTELVTWPVFASGVWAKVRERVNESGGDEAVSQGLRVNHRKVTIFMRWMAGLDSTMRVLLDDGTPMQITSLANLGRNEAITLACEQWREG